MLKITKFFQCSKGATSIEYGMIAAGLSLAIIAVVFLAGDDLQLLFEAIREPLDEIGSEVETAR